MNDSEEQQEGQRLSAAVGRSHENGGLSEPRNGERPDRQVPLAEAIDERGQDDEEEQELQEEEDTEAREEAQNSRKDIRGRQLGLAQNVEGLESQGTQQAFRASSPEDVMHLAASLKERQGFGTLRSRRPRGEDSDGLRSIRISSEGSETQKEDENEDGDGKATTRNNEASRANKRMTVVLDGEMPEELEEEPEENKTADDVASSSSVRPAEDQQQEATPMREDDFMETDAADDEGESESREEADKQDAAPQTSEAKDMLASIASLRANIKTESDEKTTSGRKPDLRGSVQDLKEEIAGKEDEEEEGDGEEENEEEDEEEEEEPTLKYSRLTGSVPDILKKDSASALAVSDRFLALGTHAGSVYILDEQGNLIKGFRSHSASVLDLAIDSTAEFVGSAGMDGIVSISALSSSENYVFDMKRQTRTIALEPGFGRRSSRAFVSGGMAGQLVLREKSWFGHRETVLHEGEGPIWIARWQGRLIAWANERGVRIYDTANKQRITFIAPPSDKPRADLFRCSLFWQDDATLLVAWADHIKVAKIKERTKKSSAITAPTASPQLYVEIVTILQLDCMISGIAPRGFDFLVLAYITEEQYDDGQGENGFDDSRVFQKRKEGLRPEMRLISQEGEELSSDVLGMQSFARFRCNDYLLVPSADAVAAAAVAVAQHSKGKSQTSEDDKLNYFYVVSPKDIVIARPRDTKDHIEWLLQHKHYEEALTCVEAMPKEEAKKASFDAAEIGRKFLSYLIEDTKDFEKAASVGNDILGENVQAWEDWIFLFVERNKLDIIAPYVPTDTPRLSGVVYDMILAHFLRTNPVVLLETIKKWPIDIYNTRAVVLAIEDRLKRMSELPKATATITSTTTVLMECLAELFIANRQPGKALTYFLRLRRPGVFDLIREHNLFTVVQDQALLLVEFEQDVHAKQGQRKSQSKHGAAIELLVDHTHSIPIYRVVSQLEAKPRYLYMYLDALFDRDSQLVVEYANRQVSLYAEYEHSKLMSYLRTMSSYYSFEKARRVCEVHDYIPEQVFLLGRIGDNKTALNLIIQRLEDVEMAIEFAKEQNDEELWDDLLTYAESRPKFIRALLENVGADLRVVDPVRLIRRIKDGLEIPGLKSALGKILYDFLLQISLLEGCLAIIAHDGQSYSQLLQQGQTIGHYLDATTSTCVVCSLRLFDENSNHSARDAESDSGEKTADDLQKLGIIFLCRHSAHLGCLIPAVQIPKRRIRGPPSLDDKTKSGVAPTFEVKMTTTLAYQRQRSGDGVSGADSETHSDKEARAPEYYRSKTQERDFLQKVAYDNRLKVGLAKTKGCPVCSSARERRQL